MILESTAIPALLIFSLLPFSAKDSNASTANEESNASQVASSQFKDGEAKGTFRYGDAKVDLKYAYARRIKAPIDQRAYAYSLLLSDQPIAEEVLKQKDDLWSSLSSADTFHKNMLHFFIDGEGKILKVSWSVSTRDLGTGGSLIYDTNKRGKTVTVSERSIQGDLKERDEVWGDWNYDVAFKANLIKL
jgi:hypothetical protein